jgi:hypothetical protein
VSVYGAQVGRPGYQIRAGECCSEDLGLTNSQAFDLRALGSFSHPAPLTAHVRQNLTGTLAADLPPRDGTPVGDALTRDRPSKDGTRTFLTGLPPSASVSAVVELTQPLTHDKYLDFMPDGMRLGDGVILTDPYAGSALVSWPNPDIAAYGRWVRLLTPDDDEALGTLGAPSVADLRAAARDPRVHAFVIDSATVGQVRDLLADPQVRSINVADVGFDGARQFPQN